MSNRTLHAPKDVLAAAKRAMELTLPCEDNGIRWTRRERLDAIASALNGTAYSLLGKSELAFVYRHSGYSRKKPTILVSTHVDSLYGQYFARKVGAEIHGTFDNSATNGVVVELMRQGSLPPQVLVAFTGDEEENSRGADQTVEILSQGGLFSMLELVMVLDLTEEAYGQAAFTLENLFVESNQAEALLRFSGKRDLKSYLTTILKDDACPGIKKTTSSKPSSHDLVVVMNAAPDESWQYDEHDLNCFSLCLPCRPLDGDMHSDLGVAIQCTAFEQYALALKQLASGIAKFR